jgi:hypothetical protein
MIEIEKCFLKRPVTLTGIQYFKQDSSRLAAYTIDISFYMQ